MLFKLPGSQQVAVCFTTEGSPEPSRLYSRSQVHPCKQRQWHPRGNTHTHTHACTRMHTHAHTHSSSTPAVSSFCLTVWVLVYPPAIHAHLVQFQTAALWVLVTNSGHSESSAKEGGWPGALNFFKPKLFSDSTDSGSGLQGRDPASRQQPDWAGEAGAWSGGCRPPPPPPPPPKAVCSLPFGRRLLSHRYGPSIIPVPGTRQGILPSGGVGGLCTDR